MPQRTSPVTGTLDCGSWQRQSKWSRHGQSIWLCGRSRNPGYVLGYFALGATYNALARFNDALRILERGPALSPTDCRAYYEMGKAQAQVFATRNSK